MYIKNIDINNKAKIKTFKNEISQNKTKLEILNKINQNIKT